MQSVSQVDRLIEPAPKRYDEPTRPGTFDRRSRQGAGSTVNRTYAAPHRSNHSQHRELHPEQIDPLEDVRENLLLAALPPAELSRLLPHLHPCCLTPGTTLLEPGKAIQRAYFVKKGVVSRILTSAEGCDVEVSITGREGVVGAEVIAGHGLGMCRAIVQLGGRGWWVPARVLKEEFGQGGAFKEVLLQYLYAQWRQSAQVALCNRLHTIESRLCSWLLIYGDRVETNDLYLSQDQIARSLGVRRASVTVVAGDLRGKGLIDYARGHLTILNRDGLQARACECYDHSTKQSQYVPPHECMLQMV